MVNLYRIVDNLISLTENKYEQLKDIYLLTEQQSLAIEAEDMDNLGELINRKQQKIDIIVNLDSQFESITDDLKTIYDIKSLDELETQSANIALLKEGISKVTDILHQILGAENINKKKIEESKSIIEEKMQGTQTGKTALKQYGGMQTYADAVFFDKKID